MSWANLPMDVMYLILTLLGLDDMASAAAVCSPWLDAVRQFAVDGRLSARQLPWIATSWRPEACTAALLRPLGSPTANVRRRCCGVHGHWLAVADDVCDMYLFHSLRRTRVELPPKNTLYTYLNELVPYSYLDPHFVSKVVLSSPPTDDGCRAAIIFGIDEVAICNLGDRRWTACPFEPGYGHVCYQDIVLYNGELVAVDVTETAWEFRFESGQLTRRMLCQIVGDHFFPHYFPKRINLRHLLVVDNRLVMVIRERSYVYSGLDYTCLIKTTGFRTMVMADLLGRNRWFTTNSIGNYATFLGRSISAAVELGPGINRQFFANCIYFTEPEVACANRMEDVGLFCLPYGPLRFEDGDPNLTMRAPIFSWMFNYGMLF